MKKYVFTKLLRSYGDINQNGNEEMTFADIREIEIFNTLEEAKSAKNNDIKKFKEMVNNKSIITFSNNDEWYTLKDHNDRTVWWSEIKIPFSNSYELHEYRIFEV